MSAHSGETANPQATAAAALPRLKGVSAGDVIRVVSRELERTLKQARGNRRKALRIALDRGHAAGILSDADLRRLNSVCDTVFAVNAKKVDAEEAVATLDALYIEALRDPTSTSAGQSTIHVAYAAVSEKPEFGTFTVIGAITGGLIGASVSVGWEVGSAVGAGVGFAVDVTVGSSD